ncbi:hypothetical protein [Rhizobium leguminosarum]|uniref:hypothetical protein n=1 Tax=Rhizobium leguminosarum TaxID=384 RepID=UPI0021BBC28E|nr:hypothetical protein [Rhizobium leguminosarum]
MSICTFAPVISSNSPVIFASRVTDVSPIPSIFSVIPLKGLSWAIAPVVALSASTMPNTYLLHPLIECLLTSG